VEHHADHRRADAESRRATNQVAPADPPVDPSLDQIIDGAGRSVLAGGEGIESGDESDHTVGSFLRRRQRVRPEVEAKQASFDNRRARGPAQAAIWLPQGTAAACRAGTVLAVG
jgi:hypothetical protein